MPIEIESVQAAPARPRRGQARRHGHALGAARIGTRERMFFTERLELLLETGVPLHEALRALEGQAGSAEMGRVIAALREAVGGGLSFSEALRQQGNVFPPTYVSLVGAGEQGGFLPRVLARLREMDERREELRSTLIAAFSYPAFLMVFSFAVVVFVLIVVFPKFETIFEMIHDQLPITTRFLMALSALLRDHWLLALLGLGGLTTLLWRLARAPQGADAIDRWLRQVPVVRDIAVQYQLVQFMHVMSLSLANGVPILDALRACREILPSVGFRRFVGDLEARVEQGRGVASGFEAARFLPELVPQMVSTAEASGSLALVTGRVADFYERELRKKLALLAKVVEPAMLLVMGVVVGLIVSSLLLPIFKASTAVH